MGEFISGLGVDLRLLFAQVTTFLIFLWVLNRFVFKRLILFMDERRREIEQGLAIREEAELRLAQIHEMRKREIDKAKKEAEAILEQARVKGDERGRELTEQAKKEAELLLIRAKRDIKHETAAAIKSVREEIAQMAIVAAEKVLERSITGADRERLTKEVVEFVDEYARQ